MGAEVHRGVNGTRASLGRRHGVGSSWRLRLGMVGIVFAQSTMRSLGETHKRFGLFGPLALQLRGDHIPTDFVVAQEASEVESSSRLDFL